MRFICGFFPDPRAAAHGTRACDARKILIATDEPDAFVNHFGSTAMVTKARLCPILAFGVALTSEVFAAQKDGSAPVLPVRVYNYARMARATLDAVEREVQNIFQQANVRVELVECAPSLGETEQIAAWDRVWGRRGVSLNLITESMAATLPRPVEQMASAFSSTVFVFCHRVRGTAKKSGIPEARLLAAIVAHELGHTVLGESSHSPSGIMKARLSKMDFASAERGMLRFSNREAKQLQASLIQ
jgi:hypothetical protein